MIGELGRPDSVSERRTIFENRFLKLYAVSATFGGGGRKDYYVVSRRDRAGTVVLRGSHEVLLVRQYRFTIDDWSWELPGGAVDDGESALDAARRECLEESGIACRSLEPLIELPFGVDVYEGWTRVFLCASFEDRGAPSSGEASQRRWVALADALDEIRRGAIRDDMTIVALLALATRDRRAS